MPYLLCLKRQKILNCCLLHIIGGPLWVKRLVLTFDNIIIIYSYMIFSNWAFLLMHESYCVSKLVQAGALKRIKSILLTDLGKIIVGPRREKI